MAYMYFPTLWQIRIASYLIPRAVYTHQCSITYDHYGEQRTHTIYCEIPPTNHRNTDDTTTSSEVSAKRMRRWLYTVKKHKQNKKIKKEKENFSSNFTREQAPVATNTPLVFREGRRSREVISRSCNCAFINNSNERFCVQLSNMIIIELCSTNFHWFDSP